MFTFYLCLYFMWCNRAMEEKLIEFVKENEFIYNKSNKYYKNIYLREKKFNELSQQINIPADKLKQRWRTLKDKFYKELKNEKSASGSGAKSPKKPWKWMDSMMFLSGVASTNENTSGNYNKNSENEFFNFQEEANFEGSFQQWAPEGTNSSTPFEIDSSSNLYDSTSDPNLFQASTNKRTPKRKIEQAVNKAHSEMTDLVNVAKNALLIQPVERSPKTQTELFFESVVKQVHAANITPEKLCHLQIEILKKQHSTLSWICCAPCIWLRTSATVHKIAITTATLLVTSLLVASPILFLISTAPSSLPRDCFPDDEDCFPTLAPPPECSDPICRLAATSILARMNWKLDPCKAFKNFSCSTEQSSSLRATKSPQEAVDLQMQQLLQHNTTIGPFRKLGRLYSSCLRQMINSSTIQLVLDKLGGYLPIGALGPSSISPLIAKIYEMGPTPLIDIYYDLSYGRRPHILLIIGDPSTSAPILENKIRWMGPKAPPYRVRQTVPKILNELLDSFLPISLTYDQKVSEKESISHFIEQLNKLRIEHSSKGFWDSSVLYNTTSLNKNYPFLNWTRLIPCNWTGAIVVRNSEYLKSVEELVNKYPTRVSHNSLLILFALGILPQGYPTPHICTKATMWALPEISSAIYMAQHSSYNLKDVISRTEFVFDALKAHLKRAPSLKGAALVKLSALKIQTNTWPGFLNMTAIAQQLDNLEITSDNWFENILNIYKKIKTIPENSFENENQIAWAYPIVSKIFYDALSHSIVVPLSVMLVPYFDSKLPPYLQYASVGVAVAKEILRSITKTFEDKAMRCVPQSVNIFSNFSRMDILIHSGGMQISYHSMLSLTGPIKGMARLPGINLTPTQVFFLVSAQELCAESKYSGIDTISDDFENILGWLIAQGGSATEVFKCPSGSMINAQKTCNVL